MYVIRTFLIITIVIFIYLDMYNNKTNYGEIYKTKTLFSKNEIEFYKKLKNYLKDKDIILLSKIRIADFICLKNNENGSNFAKYFNPIAKKHVDFIITDKEGKIKLLIELDGYSHNYKNTIKNDNFKDNLFNGLGLKLIRFNNSKNYDFNILDKYV